MRSWLGRLTLGALMIALAAPSGDARADERHPVVIKTLEALRTKRYQDALTACAPLPQGESHDQCPLLRAHALNELGRHLEAYEALRIYGALGSKEARQAVVAREAFRSALLSHLARVSVTCSAAGPAEVTVNGRLAKACPTGGHIVTSPGEIIIEVRKEGFHFAQTKIQAAAGESVTARVDLVPSSASIPAQPAPTPDKETAPETNNESKPATDNAPVPSLPPATDSAPPTSAPPTASPSSLAAELARTTKTPPPAERPLSTTPPQRGIASPWSCDKTCWVLLTLGFIAVGGTTIAIVAAASRGQSPPDAGDIPPGQVKVPLHAW